MVSLVNASLRGRAVLIIVSTSAITVHHDELMVCDRLQHVDSKRIICVVLVTVVFVLAAILAIGFHVISHLDSLLRRETQGTLIVDILGVEDTAVIFMSSFA